MIRLPPPGQRFDYRDEAAFRRELELKMNEIERLAKRPRFRVTFLTGGAAFTVTNAPSSLTELGGVTRFRTIADLSDCEQAEFVTVVSTAGSAGTFMGVQYSLDLTGAGSWAYLDGGTGPQVDIDATGPQTSGVVPIVAAARRRVLLRPVTDDGDGAADPVLGVTAVDFS